MRAERLVEGPELQLRLPDSPMLVQRKPSDLSPWPPYERFVGTSIRADFWHLPMATDTTLIEPLSITAHGLILAGYAQWRLAVAEQRDQIQCLQYAFDNELEAIRFLLQRQLSTRELLPPFTRVCLALEIEPALRLVARDRQQHAGNGKLSSGLTEAPVDVRAEVGRLAGVSTGNVTKAKQILDTAAEELKLALHRGEISINRAHEWRVRSKTRQRELLAERNVKKELIDEIKHVLRKIRRKSDLPRSLTLTSLSTALADGLASSNVPVFVLRSRGRMIFATSDLFPDAGGAAPCSSPKPMIAHKGQHQLRTILRSGEAYWSLSDFRSDARREFRKVVACGTQQMGAEVYESLCGDQRIVAHTCKSRACPSCGYLANLRWVRERLADLPDIPFQHITLTMPDLLWDTFKKNRDLLHELPRLAAKVLEQLIYREHQAIPLIMVIPHTFGRDIKFNPHLHILISAGAFSPDGNSWKAKAQLDRILVMKWWRFVVVTLLGMAHTVRVLQTDLPERAFAKLISEQYRRSWHVFIDSRSKAQIVRYAGRYLRRPPVAEHRISEVSEDYVTYHAKLRDQPGVTSLTFSLQDFIERLAHHVPTRYAHGVRYFGLLAPRTKARFYELLFRELGQQRKTKPRRLDWATSIRYSFGIDPLLDSHGHRLLWARRVQAAKPP